MSFKFPSDEEYQCTLSEEDLKKAKEELGEDPNERLGAVQTLRDWIVQQPWLKTPTDIKFLLPFLRGKKFSQLVAREYLENFWRVRNDYPEFYKGVHPDNPKLLEYMDMGVMLVLPKRDKFGRLIFMERPGHMDVKLVKEKFGLDVVFQLAMILTDMGLVDERTQVNGMIFISDNTGFKTQHTEIYNATNMKKGTDCWQRGYPYRQKAFHMYNMPPLYEAIVNLIKPFLKEKIRNRIIVHGKNLYSLYDHVDKQHLPREYLPDDYEGPHQGTVEDIVAYMKKELLQKPEVRARLLQLNSGEYGVDLSKKPNPKDDVPVASFRKLNVD